MYTKQEAAQIRHEFWTIFGQYMAPQPSSEGQRINWINYKTGVPGISFKMDADSKTATIAIALTHPDKDIRELQYEQFEQLRTMLHNTLGEEWHWQESAHDDYGKEYSRIYSKEDGVNIMNRDNWPAIISFLKPRLIALDEFWENARYAFDELR